MAVNIQEAIDEVAANVLNHAGTLDSSMDTWLVIFGPLLTKTGTAPYYPFDEEDAGERTVRNWQIPSLRIRGELPAGVSQFWQAETVIDVVNRTLEATKFARQNGYISQNQEDSVVYQYNQAWP
jgi:hypothetical protein